MTQFNKPIIIVCLSDLITIAIFLLQGFFNEKNFLLEEILGYKVTTSVFDLVVFSILKSTFIFIVYVCLHGQSLILILVLSSMGVILASGKVALFILVARDDPTSFMNVLPAYVILISILQVVVFKYGRDKEKGSSKHSLYRHIFNEEPIPTDPLSINRSINSSTEYFYKRPMSVSYRSLPKTLQTEEPPIPTKNSTPSLPDVKKEPVPIVISNLGYTQAPTSIERIYMKEPKKLNEDIPVENIENSKEQNIETKEKK